MLINPLKTERRPSPWERLETTQPTNAPLTTVAHTDEKPSTASEYDQVMEWLKAHHAEILSDPLHQPSEAVHRAVNQAVMTRKLRKIDAERLTQQVLDHMLGAGPIARFFKDPDVTEIMVNGPQVFVERQGVLESMPSLGAPQDAIRLAQHLCHHEGLEYKSSDPLMNFTWKDNGARVNIVHHAKSPTGVAITIRKRNQALTLDLADLLRFNMLSADAATLLVQALKGRLNVIFSGPPGAGKTSVIRAIALEAIATLERVISMEDTEELRLDLPHIVALVGQTETPTDTERYHGAVSLQDLFRNTLRMRYDRLIIGELRGPEAFDFLEAAMSSKGGMMTSIHLRTPEILVDRLYQIGHKYHMGMPYDVVQHMVYDTVDLMVQVEKDGTGHRHIVRITEVERDGSMRDLFRWDRGQRALVTAAPLSEARQQWIAENLPEEAS